MTRDDIIRKLTSRRLWAAVTGIIVGIVIAMGGDASEIRSIAGTITALLSAVGYMATEASIDKARIITETATTREEEHNLES